MSKIVKVHYDCNDVAVLDEKGEELEVFTEISQTEFRKRFPNVDDYFEGTSFIPIYLDNGVVVTMRNDGYGNYKDWTGRACYRSVVRETEPDEDGETYYESTDYFYLVGEFYFKDKNSFEH